MAGFASDAASVLWWFLFFMLSPPPPRLSLPWPFLHPSPVPLFPLTCCCSSWYRPIVTLRVVTHMESKAELKLLPFYSWPWKVSQVNAASRVVRIDGDLRNLCGYQDVKSCCSEEEWWRRLEMRGGQDRMWNFFSASVFVSCTVTPASLWNLLLFVILLRVRDVLNMHVVSQGVFQIVSCWSLTHLLDNHVKCPSVNFICRGTL